MRQVMVSNIQLQFDLDQISVGDVKDQVEYSIDQINGVLQRAPWGIGAQILHDPEKIRAKVTRIQCTERRR